MRGGLCCILHLAFRGRDDVEKTPLDRGDAFMLENGLEGRSQIMAYPLVSARFILRSDLGTGLLPMPYSCERSTHVSELKFWSSRF